MIIHDIKEENVRKMIRGNFQEQTIVEADMPKYCRGCFGCWLKTPGECVIKDSYSDNAQKIAHSKHLIIVSKCCYGGYSPELKAVIDRSISYLLPVFQTKDKKMFHKPRYKERITLSVLFYGDISEQEKEIAIRLGRGNGRNFHALKSIVDFCGEEELIETLERIVKREEGGI